MDDTRHNRAMKKTAITVAILIVILIAANTWPPIVGYIVIGILVSVIVGAIYAMFSVYEDTKEWNKRK